MAWKNWSWPFESDFGTLAKWMRLMVMFPPHIGSVVLFVVEREVMMRSRSEAALE